MRQRKSTANYRIESLEPRMLFATVYDLASGWSPTANPNGVWSYNAGTVPLPAITNWAGDSVLSGWGPAGNREGDFIPFWFQAPSGGLGNAPAGDVLVHSWDSGNGSSNGLANATWTSPVNGTAIVSGKVSWPDLNAGRLVDYEVIAYPGALGAVSTTGTTLASGSIPENGSNTPGNPITFSVANVPIAQGEKIELLVYTDQTSAYGNFSDVDLNISLGPQMPQAPTITSTNNATFAVGSANSFTINTTGYPNAALSESGSLPSGLTFTDNGNGTATLSGTPAIGTEGTYPLTISAANGTSPNASQLFTLSLTNTNSWIASAGGDWDTAANWSLGHVPTAAENAVINLAGTYTITHSTNVADSVNSLVSNEPITLSAGSLAVATTLQISNTLTLSGGTIDGGSITSGSSAGTLVVAASTTGTLSGVTLDVNATVQGNGATLDVEDGLVLNGVMSLPSANGRVVNLIFEGTQTLSGTGQVVFGGTDGPVNFIYVKGGNTSTSGATLTIGNGITITNTGNNSGTVAGFYSQDQIINQGTITAVGGGAINLTGPGTFAGLGTLNGTAGAINLSTSCNLGDQTVTLTGSLNLSGTIDGGSIISGSSAGTLVVPTSATGTLIGVTLDVNATVQGNGATLDVEDGLVLNGVMSLPSANGRVVSLIFEGTQTFSGTGQVVFGGTDGPVNFLYAKGGNTSTSGATLTIGNGITITNTGNNSGTVAGFYSQDQIIDQGAITAVGGGAINLTGPGTFAGLGTLNGTAGSINLNTSCSLGDQTVTLTGSLNLSGTIDGGTITSGSSAGTLVMPASTTGTLIGVTLDVNVTVQGNGATLDVEDGLVLNEVMSLPSANGRVVSLIFEGTQTFSGTGQVVFGGTDGPVNFIYAKGGNTSTSGATLTIGNGITITNTGNNSGTVAGFYSQDQIINQGTITAGTGGTIALGGANGTFTNLGTIQAFDGTIDLNGSAWNNSGTIDAGPSGSVVASTSLTVNGQGALLGSALGSFRITGNVLGDTTDDSLFNPQSPVTLDGSGTASAPQLLEAMSDDMGPVSAGFSDNFAYPSLSLAGSTYVRLVDESNNTNSGSPEAVYVGSLTVPAGATLDLNGLHLYAGSSQINGTVLHGLITQLPGSGPLALAVPIPSDHKSPSELDAWTFYERSGHAVTIVVNPGSSGSPAALSPQLNWAQVTLLDPNGHVLASASDTVAGGLLQLGSVPLSTDGTYTVNVQTASSHASSTGNYVIAAYDSTPNVQTLNLNQMQVGSILTAYSTNQWNFSGVIGQQVQFQLVGSSSPGMIFTLTGPGGYTAFTDLSTSSPLINLPTSGSYALGATGQSGATGNYSFVMRQTTVTELPVNTVYNGTLAGAGSAELFAIPVTASGPMSIVLTDPSATDETAVYASLGSAPTLQSFDYGVSSSGASHTLLVPYATVGTWYVLLYAQSVADAPSSFTLQALSSEVTLTGATPNSGAANAATTLTIQGAGFNSGSSVSLVSSGGTVYPVTSATIDLPTQITAILPAGSIPAGSYSIQVTDSDGSMAELSNVFKQVSTGQAALSTYLELPNPITRHIAVTIYVVYTNTGAVAMPAPLLVLNATNALGQQGALLTMDPALRGIGLWTSATPVGFSQSVEILASGATPGVLQPGESERIPVYYAGWLDSQWDTVTSQSTLNFSLQVIQANDPTPVNWPSMQASLQPAGINNTAWNGIFSGLQTQLGATAGGYVQLLDSEASYLGQIGQDVTDVQSLWGFAVQQADNSLNPLAPYLASATDDSLATPASLSLSFDRVFAESITGRDTVSTLGLGWSTPWQTSAGIGSDGTVTIVGPGGSQRIFQPDSRTPGAYLSQPGDTGTLAADTSGGYLLTEADGTETDYSSNGLLAYMQDTNGNRITAGYTNGKLTSLTASSGQFIDIAYNPAGLISSITDSDGRTTTYSYDASNTYLTSVTGYNGQTTTYTYNTTAGSPAQNALSTITFPGGTHQYFTYDSQGRLAGTYSDNGAEPQTFAYSLGQVSMTDGTGNTSSVYYNENGQVARSVDALGNPTYYTYDSNFNLRTVTNSLGQFETYTYNSAGQAISSTDFLGNTTYFTYSGPFNQMASMTDANGNVTNYTYNTSGDLLSTDYANGTASSSTFNPEGDATSFVNANGQPIDYTYNSAGQVLTESFSDGSSYTYTYDNQGNLLTATDATGATTFTYNSADEMSEVAYPDGTYLEFQYNAAGQRTQMVDQTGFTTNFSYDADGRLSDLTDGSGNLIVMYAYDADGRLSLKTNGNGTFTSYQYDADGNVLHLINYAPGGAINSRFDYTYNSLGEETTEATVDGAWVYGYDADGQLISAVFASTNPNVPSQNLIFNYDAMGNRTSTVINGVTTDYTVNNMNEYTSVGGVTYTYDADGNLTSDGTNAYTYNSLNQLVGVVAANSATTYTYNSLGQQFASTTNGVTTQYLIDPSGLGNVVGEYTGSGALIADYTYGLGLTSQVTEGGSYNYDFDALGSTAGITNASGSYVNKYTYLPFGESLSLTVAVPNPFQFVGEFGVQNTPNGLDSMRARDYASTVGRFITPDPLGFNGGDVNFFRYAGNDTTQSSDPLGLSTDSIDKEGQAGSLSVGGVGIVDTVRQLTQILVGASSSPIVARLSSAIGVGGLISSITETLSGLQTGDTKTIGMGLFDSFLSIVGIAAKDNPYVLAFSLGVSIGELPNAIADLAQPNSPGTNSDLPGGINAGTKTTNTVGVMDPNAMYGPAGYGSSNFVQDAGAVFPYQIDFENATTATAPVQEVTVTDQLDPNLNWSTFQLTGIGWGNFYLTIPVGSQVFETTVPMTYNGQTFEVEVQAGIQTSTGLAYATFQSIDPNTGLPPSNALTGFLPPEDGTGRGDGYFSFSVSPDANLPTGTQIRNVADITFDQGLAIATDQVNDDDPSQGTDPTKQALVTIDSGAPASSVNPLPATETSPSFTVSWSGADDANGSGIAYYNIYVSTNGQPYVLWQQNTTSTSATFNGSLGTTYSFYSVATDNVGIAQAAPQSGETTMTLPAVGPSHVDSLSQTQSAKSFPVTVSGTAGDVSFEIYVSTNGSPFIYWTTVLSSNPTATFTGTSSTTYAFHSIATDSAGGMETKAASLIEASTYVVDLDPPITSVTSAVANAAGLFTINFSGTDPGNSGVASFYVYVQVDGGAAQLIAQVPGGTGVSNGNGVPVYSGQTTYQAPADGVQHTYGFWTDGVDGSPQANLEVNPAAPDVTTSFTLAQATPLGISSFVVEKGLVERSFIRYVDVTFSQPVSSLTLNTSTITLQQWSLDGTTLLGAVNLTGVLSASGNVLELNFGASGLGGAPTTNAADGYYKLIFTNINGSGFSAQKDFYRLLGDVNGTGAVNAADLTAVSAAIGQSGSLLNDDVDGSGSINTLDKTLVEKELGRSLGAGLHLDD